MIANGKNESNNISQVTSFNLIRYRVESRIADAICKNNQLLKVGLRFEYAEASHYFSFPPKILPEKALF